MRCLSLAKSYLNTTHRARGGRVLSIICGSERKNRDKVRAMSMQILAMACGLLIFSAGGSHVLAAPEKPARSFLSEEDYLGEMPVVLSATRLAQPLSETPVAMTIIDQQMIEASGARAIADLFRLVPGMVVGYESGNRPVVSMHGMTSVYSRRMQVLIDGRSVYIPTHGGVPWSDLGLALEDIERIEVIRGPNAATYGANSFLGIISIITRGARDTPGTLVKLNAGTQAIRDGVVRVSDTMGDLDYRVTLGYQQDDGFKRRYDSQQHRYINTAFDYHLGSVGDIETRLGYSGGVNQKGFFEEVDDVPRDQETISRFEQVRWRRDLGGGDDIALQFYHNYHESDERYSTLLPVPIQFSFDNDVAGERYDLELQNTLGITRDLRSVWGLGWRMDRVLSTGYLGTDAAVDNRMWRAFLNMEWRAIPNLLFNVGTMWESDDISGSDLSPRIAANYRLTPRQTLRASASRATRNPVLIEEMGNSRVCAGVTCIQLISSSGGLEPEKMQSYEIGYFAGVSTNLSLDIRTYRDKLSGLIEGYDRPYTQPFPFKNVALDFRNRNDAVIKGIEAQFSYRPSFKDRMVLGYAHTHIESNVANFVLSAPKDRGSLLLVHALPKSYQASLGFYYVGTMGFTDTKPIKPIRRLDMRLARAYKTSKTEGDIALVFQNLLDRYDEYYPSSKRDNVFDTRVYLSFSLHLRPPRQLDGSGY